MEQSREGPGPGRNRIDVTNGEELRIWAMSMGVTEAELLRAVEVAGNRADKVRDYLQRR